MYGPSDRPIQRPETILEHLTPYVGPWTWAPHVGPIGPGKVGPTVGPTMDPQVGPTICGGDGLNRLTHLHTAYTTTLTRMMTATYKLVATNEHMDDP